MCSGADQINNGSNPATSTGIAGTIISAISNLVGGNAAKNAGDATRTAAYYRAAQLDQNASNVVAAGQRTSAEDTLKANLLASRAIAVAGASGGGVSDPTVTKVVSDITGRGAYNAGVALYNAEDQAREMAMGAQAERYSGNMAAVGGRQRQAAYMFGAAGNLAHGSSLFSKYGQSGPSKSTSNDPFDLNK